MSNPWGQDGLNWARMKLAILYPDRNYDDDDKAVIAWMKTILFKQTIQAGILEYTQDRKTWDELYALRKKFLPKHDSELRALAAVWMDMNKLKYRRHIVWTDFARWVLKMNPQERAQKTRKFWLPEARRERKRKARERQERKTRGGQETLTESASSNEDLQKAFSKKDKARRKKEKKKERKERKRLKKLEKRERKEREQLELLQKELAWTPQKQPRKHARWNDATGEWEAFDKRTAKWGAIPGSPELDWDADMLHERIAAQRRREEEAAAEADEQDSDQSLSPEGQTWESVLQQNQGSLLGESMPWEPTNLQNSGGPSFPTGGTPSRTSSTGGKYPRGLLGWEPIFQMRDPGYETPGRYGSDSSSDSSSSSENESEEERQKWEEPFWLPQTPGREYYSSPARDWDPDSNIMLLERQQTPGREYYASPENEGNPDDEDDELEQDAQQWTSAMLRLEQRRWEVDLQYELQKLEWEKKAPTPPPKEQPKRPKLSLQKKRPKPLDKEKVGTKLMQKALMADAQLHAQLTIEDDEMILDGPRRFPDTQQFAQKPQPSDKVIESETKPPDDDEPAGGVTQGGGPTLQTQDAEGLMPSRWDDTLQLQLQRSESSSQSSPASLVRVAPTQVVRREDPPKTGKPPKQTLLVLRNGPGPMQQARPRETAGGGEPKKKKLSIQFQPPPPPQKTVQTFLNAVSPAGEPGAREFEQESLEEGEYGGSSLEEGEIPLSPITRSEGRKRRKQKRSQQRTPSPGTPPKPTKEWLENERFQAQIKQAKLQSLQEQERKRADQPSSPFRPAREGQVQFRRDVNRFGQATLIQLAPDEDVAEWDAERDELDLPQEERRPRKRRLVFRDPDALWMELEGEGDTPSDIWVTAPKPTPQPAKGRWRETVVGPNVLPPQTTQESLDRLDENARRISRAANKFSFRMGEGVRRNQPPTALPVAGEQQLQQHIDMQTAIEQAQHVRREDATNTVWVGGSPQMFLTPPQVQQNSPHLYNLL